MKSIEKLNFGYSDAENYKKKANKSFFNKIFVRNKYLDDILNDDAYFLIGEKGTGKTAYAVYLSNNNYKETAARLKYIRETEYLKFISLKKQKHLTLSDYASIWKVILLLLLSDSVIQSEIDNNYFTKKKRIRAIRQAIDEYYLYAFSPEIKNAFSLVENSKRAAELFYKYFKASGEESHTITFTKTNFQVNLLYLERKFKDTFRSLKLKKNHLLFIDGIDIRPGSVDYDDYLECIKGLANAAWELNSDFFSQIKDSPGRFRIILLMRPDIFTSLHLQNTTNKLLDNSVFLDWRTTYPVYRHSLLFEIADTLLQSQQEVPLDLGDAWDYYLPWRSRSTSSSREYDDSFIDILRISYSRPRDIVTILNFLKQIHLSRNRQSTCFSRSDLLGNEFANMYSQYLMGSVRDQLSFYYTQDEYETFLSFFNFLQGQARFDFHQYKGAYDKFTDYVLEKRDSIPEFVETDEKFLQFLYDTNVICYIEETEMEPLYRWCYRERSISNISPKVRLGVRYAVHKGLLKELNLGFQKMKKNA